MTPQSPLDQFLARRERPILLGLCLLALLRIALFNAAFPLFNNVDEHAHFDTVVKYARGFLPSPDGNRYDRESAALSARYESPEYTNRLANMPDGVLRPPLWTYSGPEVEAFIASQTAKIAARKNHEAFSPPLYYLLAGGWYDLGKQFQLSWQHLLYWQRFFNLPLFALLLWGTWRLCRQLAPDSHNVRLGVMTLLSVFPQDAFFGISSDSLSPLLFVFLFGQFLHLARQDKGLPYYGLVGLTAAAAILTKLMNLPAICVLLAIGILAVAAPNRAQAIKKLLVMVGAFALPLLAWCGMNLLLLHDLTATSAKLQQLTWTAKPLGQFLPHPLFTARGFGHFFYELTTTFWRGEFSWYGEHLLLRSADYLYLASTALFLGASLPGLRRHGQVSPQLRRFARLGLACLACYLLLLVFFSLRYDFGTCPYPSRALPFLTSGRLMLGILVPFLILYVQGIISFLQLLCSRLSPLFVIAGIALYCLASELYISLPVFASPYNLFHLTLF